MNYLIVCITYRKIFFLLFSEKGNFEILLIYYIMISITFNYQTFLDMYVVTIS